MTSSNYDDRKKLLQDDKRLGGALLKSSARRPAEYAFDALSRRGLVRLPELSKLRGDHIGIAGMCFENANVAGKSVHAIDEGL